MPVSLARPLLCGLIAAGVAACAHYAPLPLDHEARYAGAVSALQGGAVAPAALTLDDVTRLILQNNPSLKLAGLRRAEAHAQAETGALPPNPSFSGSLGYLLSGAGDATAWTAAIAEPVNGLITLRARRAEARATTAEVDASLAWEAWQTVVRGRQLTTDILLNEQLFALQVQMAQILRQQWEAAGRAEQAGDMDRTVTAPMAQAASEADAAAAETERTLSSQRRDLRALMGLGFDAPLSLAPLPPWVPLAEAEADVAIHDLPRHRPDLVALAMGYEAQDAHFRAAVLSQFPALSLGYDASRDNSRVTNGGPAFTVDLPIFDRGTANARAEQFTRERLHAEYSQRVADARDEARALIVANRLAESQLRRLAREEAAAPGRTAAASAALARGDLDRTTYSGLAVASLSAKVAQLHTELAMRDQRIGLEALLGMGMPVIDTEKEFQ
ncbi:outer membrane protein TolC [Luteibacter sp. 621]|uniref:TolC family protein n=1 Tax=Luteibacter sp. 621 TaxID=3373916 RepID=UPI003D1D6FA7